MKDTDRDTARQEHFYPNMDIMRYVLAMAVLIAHTNLLAHTGIPFPISSFEGVGGFFALSGFLMYPSFMKHQKSGQYIRSRARRLLPQYLFVILVSAFGCSLLSILPAAQYFTDSGFYKYLAANITFLNWLHPELPGVFVGNEYVSHAVNGSLWTMKVEWCLYLSVPLFAWCVARTKRHPRVTAFIIILMSICYRMIFAYLYAASGREIYNILGRQIFGQFSYFYCGMVVYFYLEQFKKYIGYILLISAILLFIPVSDHYVSIVISPFVISTLVLSLSLWPKDIRWLRHKENISYNMYLWHWPVIQLCVWSGIDHYGDLYIFIFVIGVTVLLSIITEKVSRMIVKAI